MRMKSSRKNDLLICVLALYTFRCFCLHTFLYLIWYLFCLYFSYSQKSWSLFFFIIHLVPGYFCVFIFVCNFVYLIYFYFDHVGCYYGFYFHFSQSLATSLKAEVRPPLLHHTSFLGQRSGPWQVWPHPARQYSFFQCIFSVFVLWCLWGVLNFSLLLLCFHRVRCSYRKL